jgi:hypothetical protein
MDTLKGVTLIGTFIGVLTIFVEAAPIKIGVVAFTTTLMGFVTLSAFSCGECSGQQASCGGGCRGPSAE